MINSKNLPLIQLNLGLIFISTSGVLGKYITVDSTIATWWRASLACILLYAFCKVSKISLKIVSTDTRQLLWLSGVLMAAHWLTYFYALDYSNVAIALLTLYTFPAFSALLEPLLLKHSYDWKDLALAFMSLIGVWIIVPEFELSNDFTIAILLGLGSALIYALRNIAVKHLVEDIHSSTIMFHQILVVVVILLPSLVFLDSRGVVEQFGGLFLLAFLTTVLGHTLFVKSMQNLSATTAGLLSCIVPVYGVFWAYLFLGEEPAMKTLIGGLVILAAVAIKTIIADRSK